jgi:hypothetical protein
MRFYPQQHQWDGGIDIHARSMYVGIVIPAGEIMLHRTMKVRPDTFLKAIAPYRAGLVVAVECMFTWDWLAALCAQEGMAFVRGHAPYMKVAVQGGVVKVHRMAFVRGHALYMKALHGGKAKNDKIDAQKMALWLRGGLLPQADGYPAQMRATRDLLRRPTHLMRKRADLLAHVQNTHSQYNLPEIGKKIAYKANRAGVAERFDDPAVPKTLEVDLALLTYLCCAAARPRTLSPQNRPAPRCPAPVSAVTCARQWQDSQPPVARCKAPPRSLPKRAGRRVLWPLGAMP